MKFHTMIPLLLAAGVFVSACGGGTSSSADDNSSYDTVDTSSETDQETGGGTSPSGSTIPDGARFWHHNAFNATARMVTPKQTSTA